MIYRKDAKQVLIRRITCGKINHIDNLIGREEYARAEKTNSGTAEQAKLFDIPHNGSGCVCQVKSA